MKRLSLLLLVLMLAVASTAATCGGTPRHDTTVGVTVLTKSLGGLQDGIVIACNTGILKTWCSGFLSSRR